MTSTLTNSIYQALDRNSGGLGPFEVVEEAVWQRGERWYIPIRAVKRPSTLFPLIFVIASAEVDLRDQGLDVELRADFPQSVVAVAKVASEEARYAFLSEEGKEQRDLAQILGRDFPQDSVTIESYPYDVEEGDREKALEALMEEYPTAKQIGSW